MNARTQDRPRHQGSGAQEQPKNEVAKTAGSTMPTFLQEQAMSGAGVSTAARDILIPMARILQKTSQEVEEQGANYIAGAKPGMILMKNAPHPLLDGQKGFLFQPCTFHQGVVEWIPISKGGGGGAGFVTFHNVLDEKDIAGAEQVPDPQNAEKLIWMLKAKGTQLVATRYHTGFMITDDGAAMPLVIPFASTGHTVSRGWMMNMSLKRTPQGKTPDSFAVLYRLTTRLKAKGQLSWHMFEVHDAGPPDDVGQPTTLWVASAEDYLRGKKLYDDISAGRVDFEKGAPEDDAAKPAADGSM